MPIQTTTDCGSELTVLHGLALALREAFAPGLNAESRAHVFLRSVHNIRIERGWLDLRNLWGHNIPYFWDEGKNIFIEGDPIHLNLMRFLWPKLAQQSLDELRDFMNNHRSRKNRKKALPSGCTPNEAYAFPEEYAGVNCLQRVDVEVIDELMAAVCEGEDVLNDWDIPQEFEEKATTALAALGLAQLTITFQNIWDVFSDVLRHIEE